MKSPRTTYEFHISEDGLKKVEERTWQCTDANFTKMARIIFGLDEDGPPPMWTLIEIMRIVKDSGLDA